MTLPPSLPTPQPLCWRDLGGGQIRGQGVGCSFTPISSSSVVFARRGYSASLPPPAPSEALELGRARAGRARILGVGWRSETGKRARSRVSPGIAGATEGRRETGRVGGFLESQDENLGNLVFGGNGDRVSAEGAKELPAWRFPSPKATVTLQGYQDPLPPQFHDPLGHEPPGLSRRCPRVTSSLAEGRKLPGSAPGPLAPGGGPC